MSYDPNGFPTIPSNVPVDPTASINNVNSSVMAIPNANDPPGSIYYQNQVGFSKTLLINRIFNLLVDMVDALTKVAAAQANYLNFLTQWQKAYTDDLNQIHSFAANNGDSTAVAGSTSQASDVRTSMNQLNSTFTTELQNLRSVVSDTAKSAQTNVSQTADAVNAQSSLATSFLSQLDTLTQTIFRST